MHLSIDKDKNDVLFQCSITTSCQNFAWIICVCKLIIVTCLLKSPFLWKFILNPKDVTIMTLTRLIKAFQTFCCQHKISVDHYDWRLCIQNYLQYIWRSIHEVPFFLNFDLRLVSASGFSSLELYMLNFISQV